MNFYRHWYNLNEVRNKMLSDISSLGFYSTDTNEPYDGVSWERTIDGGSSVIYNAPRNLYWYKDLIHKCTLQRYVSEATQYEGDPSVKYRYRGAYYRISPSTKDTYSSHDSTPGYACSMLNTFNGNYPYYYYPIATEVFFMPLKDGGFLLNNKLPDYMGGTYGETGKSTFNMKIMPCTYSEGNPTAIGIDATDEARSPFYNTLIGIPPTNKSAVSNYIYIFSSYQRRSYASSIGYVPVFWDNKYNYFTDLTPFFDLQTNTITRYNFFKMHNKYYRPTSAEVNKQYMNFIPNVCVLSKIPYDNGFIDNIYYMTTCPTASISDDNYRGIFFSFAGRNFINIYGNMVLELPSY